MFAIIGIVVVFGRVIGRVLDGAREHDGFDAAGGADHHFRRRDWNRPGCESAPHSDGHRKRDRGSFWWIPFDETEVSGLAKMMYELFSRARKEGLMSLEADSDAPDQSQIFSKYPKFLKDHHALAFVCDFLAHGRQRRD